MKEIKFEWDENKNTINKRKHGIDFLEAVSVFNDYNALIIPDPDHSIIEERFVILGFSKKARLLVVNHCYRNSDSIIRIISSREATKSERSQYYLMNGGTTQ